MASHRWLLQHHTGMLQLQSLAAVTNFTHLLRCYTMLTTALCVMPAHHLNLPYTTNHTPLHYHTYTRITLTLAACISAYIYTDTIDSITPMVNGGAVMSCYAPCCADCILRPIVPHALALMSSTMLLHSIHSPCLVPA
jgi:hypothetical protein